MSGMRHFEDYCWRDVVSADLLAIYKAYHRHRAVPQRTAVLVLHPGPEVALTVQPVWPGAAGRIIGRARDRAIPVLHSVPPNGTLAPGLDRNDDEPLVPRPADSAFLFSDLAAALTI